MASFIGHAVVAGTLSRAIFQNKDRGLLALAIFSAIMPDFDVAGFYMGIPYEHPLGHRGFSHSILFALIWSLGWTIWRKRHALKWFLVVFLSTLSHGIIDAFTNGGRGIGFFIPFSMERHFFPNRPIVVSPLHIEDFFGEWGMAVIVSEIKYLLLPCLIIFGVGTFLGKKIAQNTSNID